MPEHDDLQAVQELNDAYRLITERLGQVIVGQQQVIEELLVAMFARGHCLLVGVPGLAKTLMIRTLADALSLEFRRIQFTPDLMPSDITGTEVIQEDRGSGSREFRFLPGPIFGNVILADEINRTPPKTQAALLEAMQEYQITAGGRRHRLGQPFFVLATQNPIEHEGTYPLPEAQLDRFMFNTFVDYPEEEEEFDIVRRTTADFTATVTPVLSGERILELQKIVRRVPVADHVVRYAMKLVRLTRPRSSAAAKRDDVPPFIRDYVSWGAGPRASQFLVLGAKARAVLHGRFCAGIDDVRAVALPVLRHRIVTNFNAEAEGIKPEDLVRRLLDTLGDDDAPAEKLSPVFRREGGRGKGEGGACFLTVENAHRLLDSRMLARLQGLPLRARSTVEGYVSGVHRSPFHGFSIEFAEHREYASGDDLRYLDWKVFGRTDKYYLKQFEDETNLVCHLLLDTSESMRYRSDAAPCSKLEYAQRAAATLAYLVLHQQDSVGLVAFDGEIRSLVRASSNPSHLKQILHVMEGVSAERKTSIGPIFHDLAERLKKRGIVIVLSDLFDDVEVILTGLKHLRHRRHEVIAMHVLDPAEMDFPFERITLFRGLEQLPDVLAEPRASAQGLSGRVRSLSAPAPSRLPRPGHRLRSHADGSTAGGSVVEIFGIAEVAIRGRGLGLRGSGLAL